MLPVSPGEGSRKLRGGRHVFSLDTALRGNQNNEQVCIVTVLVKNVGFLPIPVAAGPVVKLWFGLLEYLEGYARSDELVFSSD